MTKAFQSAFVKIHGMSWWACFNDEPQLYSAQDPDDLKSQIYFYFE